MKIGNTMIALARARAVEQAALMWLAKAGPGAHPGCLRLDVYLENYGLGIVTQVLRVVAGPAGGGPELLRLPPVRLELA